MTNGNAQYRLGADVGGTFTDVYAEVPGKPEFRVVKLLSEDPQRFLAGVGGVAGYSLVFIFFGILIFSRRDV